ncbi:MAG: YkgJ family cysteine cluster protein [Candidatus Helarchaeota archaeon]
MINNPEDLKLKCIKCGNCCKETEMEITNAEINKLESLGYVKDEFIVVEDGYQKLRNINGYCYFFNRNKNICKIYEFRPLGCKFYPIILNINNECEIDRDCSCYKDNNEIEIPKEICNMLKKYVNILDEEIRNRVK